MTPEQKDTLAKAFRNLLDSERRSTLRLSTPGFTLDVEYTPHDDFVV